MMSNWLTISQSAGTGNATITVNAQSNPGFEQRTARIIVSNGTISKTVSILQESKTPHIDYLLISGPYNYYIPYSGGSITSASVLSEIIVYAHYENYPPGQGFVDVTSAATITISPNDYTCGVNTSFDEYGKYLGTFNVYASYSGISTSNSPSVYQDAVPDSRKIVYSGTSLIGIENSDDLHNGDDSTTVLATVFNSTSGLGMFIVDKDITYLPYRLFAEESGVTAINIPSTVSGWNESCFLRCRNLTTVNGLENLAQLSFRVGGNVNGYQFYDCNGLTHVGLPASLPCNSNSYSLPYKMFGNCSSLTTLIYAGTMAQFDALKKHADWKTGSSLRYVQCSDGTIDLDPPQQNNVIIYYAPNQQSVNTDKLTPAVSSHTFSSGVGTITCTGDITRIEDGSMFGADGLFYNCSAVTKVILPNTITYIGNKTFRGCSNLSDVNIPENSVFGDNVFNGTSITELTVPSANTEIKIGLCQSCSSLSSVTLPNTITSIKSFAFSLNAFSSITLTDNITSIGQDAFDGCTNLTSVHIPSGLTEIKNYTFKNAPLTGNLVIPENVTSIGMHAFAGHHYDSITISEKVTSIGNGAFYIDNVNNCSALTLNMTGNTTIGNIAFLNGAFSAITLPVGVTSIGSSFAGFFAAESPRKRTINYKGTMAQWNQITKDADWYKYYTSTDSYVKDNVVHCSDGDVPVENSVINYYSSEQLNITESAITPSISSHTFSNGVGIITSSGNITEINRSGFTNCSGMTAIELPDSLEAIHSYAFTSAMSLTSITIPDSVTVLGSSVFWRCTGLTSVNIPTGITTINDSTFSTCSSLTGITIPDNITYIDQYAFYKCTSLTGITIPSGVTDIKSYAFANCTSLATINYAGTTSEWANINLSSNWLSGGVPAIAINCTDGIVMLLKDTIMYSAATQLNVSSNVITPSFTSHTFSNGVGTIKTSGNITAIAENGFKNCSGLTNIMLPNSITTIGQSAFENCFSLALITIPSGITSIDDFVFDSCESLTSIVIPDNVTNIGWKSFEYCSNLLEVTIPTSVTFIETYAFKDCTNLVDINYKGTMAQWNNITIESEWISTYADDAAIHCTDGDIPLWEPWP